MQKLSQNITFICAINSFPAKDMSPSLPPSPFPPTTYEKFHCDDGDLETPLFCFLFCFVLFSTRAKIQTLATTNRGQYTSLRRTALHHRDREELIKRE